MTPAGRPPDRILSVYHRRFPVRQHLWAGSLRLWRVELAVRNPKPSRLFQWVARATDPLRLGLPQSIVESARADGIARQSFAFVELPTGPVAIPLPAGALDAWPEPTPPIPQPVLTPTGVDLLPFAGDWRTVPIVRAESMPIVAVQMGELIEMYAVGLNEDVEEPVLCRLPADVFPIGSPSDWAVAYQAWTAERDLESLTHHEVRVEGGVLRVPELNPAMGEAWICAGAGPLHEAALITPA